MRAYLGSFMFSGDEIEKYVKVLSGGEKARVALARMLVKPSHLLLLDEPTNHLDMVTRNVVERALIQFSGSIVCISHDRHFLNNVTNLTCEVGDGGIRLFEGNYEYYEWKKQVEKSAESPKPKIKSELKGKSDYKEQKKVRNRLSWIKKRFTIIENELKNQRSITQDPANGDDYELLQKAMETMTILESKYLKLMEEQESLNAK
jgi:ATP-binding cassette subfamily F protein 3